MGEHMASYLPSGGEEYSVSDVINSSPEFEGYIPTAAIIIVTALDPDTGKEDFFFLHDTENPIWKHAGMIEMTRVHLDEGIRENRLFHTCTGEEDEDD